MYYFWVRLLRFKPWSHYLLAVGPREVIYSICPSFQICKISILIILLYRVVVRIRCILYLLELSTWYQALNEYWPSLQLFLINIIGKYDWVRLSRLCRQTVLWSLVCFLLVNKPWCLAKTKQLIGTQCQLWFSNNHVPLSQMAARQMGEMLPPSLTEPEEY